MSVVGTTYFSQPVGSLGGLHLGGTVWDWLVRALCVKFCSEFISLSHPLPSFYCEVKTGV